MIDVPLWEKPFLTVEEASAYFNIGENKIRKITEEVDDLVVFCGKKRLIKREKLEEFLNESFSV